ncbi:MAG: oxygen-dependent coproporphyrinogen oxidase [Deltaproteobacteria bacterium]|nr:MAG: oxygen-dependent coproporphyrinogen oxidase [Deltaproteobacteria bacterium]
MDTTGLSDPQRRAHEAVRTIQGAICRGLEAIEAASGSAARFREDTWERPGGGGGWTRVLQGGRVLEKGGVNVSVVHGKLGDDLGAQLPGRGEHFFATGVSLVLHPVNPHAPTVHANYRYLERGDQRWFGGGADLTPHYYYEEDATHFHQVHRNACEAHADVADYAYFRDWCDHYFYIRHRKEHRGVGGIFFDYQYVTDDDAFDRWLAFVIDAGAAFREAYEPILTRRKDLPYGDRERTWQLQRRGRYAEFNLVYDRGTVFGLKTQGRIESILMSLPPVCRWDYDVRPEPGSPEAKLLEVLTRPVPAGPFPG